MTRSTNRDRPLWQFFLAILLVFFAIQRGQLTAMLFLSGASPALVIAYGLQVALALATALAIWLGWGRAVAFVILLGLAVAGTVLLEAFHQVSSVSILLRKDSSARPRERLRRRSAAQGSSRCAIRRKTFSSV